MKRILPFLLLPLLSSAAPVSPEEALRLVEGYRSFVAETVLDGPLGKAAGAPRELAEETGGERVVLAYAVPLAPEGWIVVAADDRANPVVAFSAEGVLGDDFDDPDNPFRGFLVSRLAAAREGMDADEAADAEKAADEEASAEGGGAAPAAPVRDGRWDRYLGGAPKEAGGEDFGGGATFSSLSDLRVGPILATQWNQSGNGENYYTPSNWVCGCLATAFGQIFRHFEWPQAGIGVVKNQNGSLYDASGTYLARSKTPSVAGQNVVLYTRGGDGNGGAYNWSDMTATTSSTDAQKRARGALLADIGVVLGASYNKANDTQATPYISALAAVFGYQTIRSTGVQGRSTHGTYYTGALTAMTNAFLCNLDAGRPCSVLGGKGNGGHQVDVDGYGYQDGQLYYHVNLGWGASTTYNGYYAWDNWQGYSTEWIYFNFFPDFTGEIVSGRIVKADGTPFAGVTVSVAATAGGSGSWTATTGANGIWAVAGVPSGSTLEIVPSYPDYSFGTQTVSMGTSSSTSSNPASGNCGNRWGVDFVGVSPTLATVFGSVTLAGGTPAAGLVVSAGSRSATVGDNGMYAFDLPAGFSGPLAVSGEFDSVSPSSVSLSGLQAGTAVRKDFTVSCSYGRALDCLPLVFESDSSAPWVVDYAEADAPSRPCVRSAAIGDNASTWLRTTVTGPGTVSFRWKAESESVSYDWLSFSVGSSEMAKIGGFGSSGATTDWTEVSFEIPSGSQTLEWLYRKDGGTVKGRDAGWLDALVWTPVSPDPEISASLGDPESGAIPVSWTLADHGSGASSATLSVEWSTAPSFPNPQSATIGSFSAPQSGTFVLSGLSSRTTYYLRVRATNAAGGEAVTDVLSATTGDPAVGWFDVKWASDGYGTETAWWNAAAERTSGGRWAVPAGDASSRRGSVLELALPEGGELRFTAVSPSAGGGCVTVDGTLSPVLASALPDPPAGAFAALSFARGGYKAWNGAQWIALSGVRPSSAATAWTATFDFSSTPHKVRYAVGGQALSASGSEWIPLASAAGCVRGVGYAGGGSVGNFKATCAGGFPVPALATLAGDGVEPLVFGGTTAAPTLTVTIGNAQADVWYAVYESASVGGPWTFAGRAQAQRDGTLPFTIDATAATKFLRLKASESEISPANPLFPSAP